MGFCYISSRVFVNLDLLFYKVYVLYYVYDFFLEGFISRCTMYREFLALAYNPQTTCKLNLPHFNKYIC